MSFPVKYRTAVNSTSGVFTANDASSAVETTSTVLNTADVEADALCANVSLSLYTIALAVRAKWQGSSDKSTWVDYVPSNNAANVTLQSGTGTASVSIAAPGAVTSKKYARLGLYIVGASTGTASDTYTVSYSYRQYNPFSTRA